jgi:hydroxylamine dehydrogenase
MFRLTSLLLAGFLYLVSAGGAAAAGPQVSEDSQTCLECHQSVTPGIVADWRASAHAKTTPAAALAKPELQRRVSAARPPKGLEDLAVGCAECHVRRADKHAEAWDHQGFTVHLAPGPDDCAACHPQEGRQYARNIMSHAYGNLKNNPLFTTLTDEVNAPRTFENNGLRRGAVHLLTDGESCYSCHGTKLVMKGMKARETSQGEMEFPVLQGWPNAGVGRMNTDGSKGSCSSCHPRHRFSLKVARSPYTCSQCHKGPDVPAYKIYQVSKHGNIHQAQGKDWDFEAVPWTVGKDFAAPTCAACHASLVVNGDGEVLAKRTHQFNDRLDTRLFGTIYAHAHPVSPDTTVLKAPDGLPLPASLDGRPAAQGLIGKEEQARRRAAMRAVCHGCHGGGLIQGHFESLDHTTRASNAQVKTVTALMSRAWETGLAKGPAQGASPFDEYIERIWCEQWLFHANSVRLAAAMLGSDYGVFDQGRWDLTRGMQRIFEKLKKSKK